MDSKYTEAYGDNWKNDVEAFVYDLHTCHGLMPTVVDEFEEIKEMYDELDWFAQAWIDYNIESMVRMHLKQKCMRG